VPAGESGYEHPAGIKRVRYQWILQLESVRHACDARKISPDVSVPRTSITRVIYVTKIEGKKVKPKQSERTIAGTTAAFPLIGDAPPKPIAAAKGGGNGNFSPALVQNLSLVKRAKVISGSRMFFATPRS
jgi:hypothetical protein